MPTKRKRISEQELGQIRNDLLAILKDGEPDSTQKRLEIFRDAMATLKKNGVLLNFLHEPIKDWGSLLIAAAYFERYGELELLLQGLPSSRSTPKKSKRVQELLTRSIRGGVNCLDILVEQGMGNSEYSLIRMILEALPDKYVSNLLMEKAQKKQARYVVAIIKNHSQYGQAERMLLNFISKNPVTDLTRLHAADLNVSTDNFLRAIRMISANPTQPQETANQRLARYLFQSDEKGQSIFYHTYIAESQCPDSLTLEAYGQENFIEYLKELEGGLPGLLKQAVENLNPAMLMFCIEQGVNVHEEIPDVPKVVEALAVQFNRLAERYQDERHTVVANNITESRLKSALTLLEILSHTGLFLGRIFEDKKGHLDKMLSTLADDYLKSILGENSLNNVLLYASVIGIRPSEFYFAGYGRRFMRYLQQSVGWYDPTPVSYGAASKQVFQRIASFFGRMQSASVSKYHGGLQRSLEGYIQDFFAGVEGDKAFGWRSDAIKPMQQLAQLFYAGQSLQKLLLFVIPPDKILQAPNMPGDLRLQAALSPKDSELIDRLLRDNRGLEKYCRKLVQDHMLSARLTPYIILNLLNFVGAFLLGFAVTSTNDDFRVPPAIGYFLYALMTLYFSVSTVFLGRHYRLHLASKASLFDAVEKNIADTQAQYKRLPEASRTREQDEILTIELQGDKELKQARKALGRAHQTLSFLKARKTELAPEAQPAEVVIQMP